MDIEAIVTKLKATRKIQNKAKLKARLFYQQYLRTHKFQREEIVNFIRENHVQLAELRAVAKLGQKEMSEMADVPLPYISLFENGDVNKIPTDQLYTLLCLYREL